MPFLKPSTGAVLRLLGPLIQIICLATLFRLPNPDVRVAGLVSARTLLYDGLVIGLLLVIAGVTLVKRPKPARRPLED